LESQGSVLYLPLKWPNARGRTDIINRIFIRLFLCNLEIKIQRRIGPPGKKMYRAASTPTSSITSQRHKLAGTRTSPHPPREG
jgi:hypothetical protein